MDQVVGKNRDDSEMLLHMLMKELKTEGCWKSFLGAFATLVGRG
jgi:hypothetical protein